MEHSKPAYANYASPKVSERQIASWLWQPTAVTFEDIIGKGELKREMRMLTEPMFMVTDKTLKLPLFRFNLLTGPSGTGKTLFARACANELTKQGYRALYLDPLNVLSNDAVGVRKAVETAFALAADMEPCLLIFEDVDLFCPLRGAQIDPVARELVYAFAMGYRKLRDEGRTVILMGLTSRPDHVDDIMVSRAHCIRFPLPGDEEKTAYFRSRAGQLVRPEAGYSFEEMAEELINYNYRELDRLWEHLVWKLRATAAGEAEPAAGALTVTRDMFQQARMEQPACDKSLERKVFSDFEKSFLE